MGEFLSRIQTQVSDLLQSLDSRQRVIYGLIAAALVIVLGLGVFFYDANKLHNHYDEFV